MFQPSPESYGGPLSVTITHGEGYGDAAPAAKVDPLAALFGIAPALITAGTEITTTAITGRKKKKKNRRPAEPAAAAASPFPVVPVAIGVVFLAGVGYVLTRPPAPAAART